MLATRAFTFKGKAVDVKQIGRELNVRYVLEGSVQRGGNRLRVNVQLIDAETGNHLWAERFDKPVADLFDMQDEIVSRLANTLNAQLIAVEARRAERSPHPDATGLVFPRRRLAQQGVEPPNTWHKRVASMNGPWRSNREMLRRWSAQRWLILQLAPTCCTDDRIERLTAAEAAVTKALSLAPNHPMAHFVLGLVQIFTNRAAQGIAECERALALDRNLAQRAREHRDCEVFSRSGRGNRSPYGAGAPPLSPRYHSSISGVCLSVIAKFWQGADAEAIVWLRRSLEANRNHPIAHFDLAAVLAHVGELDEARATAQAGLALNPSFSYPPLSH